MTTAGDAGPVLVLAAHGSSDPGAATVTTAIADAVRARRLGLDVRIGYLDHGAAIDVVAADGGVVVPLLLSSGVHVRVDLPALAPRCVIARAVGPDRRLVDVLLRRLRDAGWSDAADADVAHVGLEPPVVLAAAGSSDPDALDDVRLVAGWLATALGVPVEAGFASAGEPGLAALVEAHHPAAVVSYLLAPGRFAAAMAGLAPIVTAPIGAAAEVSEIVLDRYDEAAHPRQPR